ncbi:MAG: NAD(P)-dependent oxidoreductase [Cyclobacteriaceae bacterium]|nr:MAG: NAD(P)-dependent oxidoreductase [Cyclobacteriaceae bacterium]
MKTVLVTGANGLLGQKLIRLLAADPALRTVATARQPLYQADTGATFYPLDITNANEIHQVFSETQPDVVINTAAATQVDWCEQHPDACYEINTNAVALLLQACRQTGTAFVQLSTDFIFNGNHGPLDETAQPDPVNIYGQSKLQAEQAVMKSGLNWCIIRTVLVYGVARPLGRSNIVLWVKQSLEQKKPIQVVTDQKRTPTLAEDLARGCYLAIKHQATGIYHISGEELMSPYDIALQTARFFSLDETLISPADSTTFRQPARRPLITGFIINKAKTNLGYTPHTFTQGLALIKQQLNL